MPVLPNPMGIPVGADEPINTDWCFPDNKDNTLAVSLHFSRSFTTPYDPRNNHWMVVWQVGVSDRERVLRRLHVVRHDDNPHLTNWGPVTKATSTATTNRSREYKLKDMTYAQRQHMEAICRRLPIQEPDGEWNCQDWIITLLKLAERDGLITRAEWEPAVRSAQSFGI
ncbi:hypothetical protein FPV67DRAFT_1780432 [Lyophyllum atratum]|nr:hypothetical protein FPV67DRAFT_1780432 [Lyophyllum atratum]